MLGGGSSELMKIKIRLSEKHEVCPNALKGFFYRFGFKFENALSGFVKDFTPYTICEFNQLKFLPGEDLLMQSEWVVEADESESVAVMAINGRPVAATIHSQIRGADGGISGKADLSDQCIGGFLKSLPAEIRHIGIFSCDLLEDLNPLIDRADLLTLSLAQCDGVRDISPLEAMEKLQSLDFSGLDRLGTIDSLEKTTSLRCLVLDDCRAIERIDPLAACKRLELLNLSSCWELKSIEPLRGLSSLKNLNLFQCSKVKDFSAIASLSSLETLKISGLSGFNNFDFLARLTELCELDISRGQALGSVASGTNLNFLSELKKMQILEAESWERLEDISSLAGLEELENLNLGKCSMLKDLSPLADLPKLATIGVSGCKSLRDLSPLAKISALKSLSRFRNEGHADLQGCESLEDLHAISTLGWISDLKLSQCRAVGDLGPLSQLQNLESLDLQDCAAVSNLASLSRLRRLKKLSLQGCKRLKSLDPLRNITSLAELKCDFHPAPTVEILAHAAWRRRDTAIIENRGSQWGKEALACEKDSDSELEKLVTTLCAAFSLLGEHKLAKPTENLLDRHPEFSSAPWKAWFGGTLQESGFELYKLRVERVLPLKMAVGAVGGACATLPFETNSEWSLQWLERLEGERSADAKALLSVAPEICLAYARSGQIEALGRWVGRFTDPSDPGALDPVQAALAAFQMNRGDWHEAEGHIFAVQSSQSRDPLLQNFVEALVESNPEKATTHLLLIENQSIRSKLAKQLVVRTELANSESILHRLIVATDESPATLAELISALPIPYNQPLIQKISEALQLPPKALLMKLADDLERAAARYRSEAM
jgi:Leucine-rich repeat (LRR) protein